MAQKNETEDELPLGPALDFMRSLWRLNHAIECVSKGMEATLGITAQQRMFLRCLGKYPGITAGQLAAQLHLDAGSVSAMAAKLEGRGLISRRRGERDRRRVSLGLTEAGRALDAPASGTIESAVEAVLRACPPEELAATRRVLDALTAELWGGKGG